MTERRQFIGYDTSAECNQFTGYVREISINNETKSIRVHDGVTAGGFETARNDMSNISKSTIDSKIAPSLAEQVPPLVHQEVDADIGDLQSRVSTNETSIAELKSTTEELDKTKADNATTLAGYHIDDAYTKDAVDSKLAVKANSATTLSGYGIGDAYTKTAVDGKLAQKANKANSLVGYGITDAYTKGEANSLLNNKANKATTLAGYGIGDAYTKAQTDAAITKAGALPNQSGQSGKFLTTNGSQASWANVYSAGNIGDIKYTTANQTPNGGAWCDGSEYTQAQFPQIYQMLVDNKLARSNYANYNDCVSSYGSCGFFGLDTTNKKFKVPTLTNIYIKAGQIPDSFGVESLPNITGNIGGLLTSGVINGAFSNRGQDNSSTWGGSDSWNNTIYADFSASRSSATYKNGAKVNPDHVVYRAYVVLYSTAVSASVAQAAEFIQSVSNLTQQMNNKININADNISATGYANIFKNILPDYGAPISVNTSRNYTAPNYGWFRFNSTKDSEQNITIKNVTKNLVIYSGGAAKSYSPTITDFIFVEKGHVYQFTKDWGNFGTLYFYPMRGV